MFHLPKQFLLKYLTKRSWFKRWMFHVSLIKTILIKEYFSNLLKLVDYDSECLKTDLSKVLLKLNEVVIYA